MSEKVVFVELDLEYDIFWNINTKELNLKILLFNYWNNLALGSLETCILEVGTYLCLKGVTEGV